jgi:hypothetical protein
LSDANTTFGNPPRFAKGKGGYFVKSPTKEFVIPTTKLKIKGAINPFTLNPVT